MTFLIDAGGDAGASLSELTAAARAAEAPDATVIAADSKCINTPKRVEKAVQFIHRLVRG